MNITSSDIPQSSQKSSSKPDVHDVMLVKWQQVVDLIANVVGVPAALITKVHPSEMEISIASDSKGNPFRSGTRDNLNIGHYCEEVISQRGILLVPDARKDPKWAQSPDLELGMVAYMGLPLIWPDGEIFGTICVLDDKENPYTGAYQELMRWFKGSVEVDLKLLCNASEQQQAQKELQKSMERFRLLFSRGNDAIYVYTLTNGTPDRFIEVNDIMCQRLGYTREELLGINPRDLVPLELSDEAHRVVNKLSKEKLILYELEHATRDGSRIPVEISSHQFDFQGKSTVLSVARDITERKWAENRLQELANHDELTKLPNRRLFHDRLEHALVKAKRSGNLVAILYLDLDDFKIVNDTLGHDRGDMLLRAIAKRLVTCVREADTVARLGGDEFTLILEDIHESQEIVIVAGRVIKAFARPFIVGEHEISVTTSIGISIYSDDSLDGKTLLKNADKAMYRAKGQGKNKYQFFASKDKN